MDDEWRLFFFECFLVFCFLFDRCGFVGFVFVLEFFMLFFFVCGLFVDIVLECGLFLLIFLLFFFWFKKDFLFRKFLEKFDVVWWIDKLFCEEFLWIFFWLGDKLVCDEFFGSGLFFGKFEEFWFFKRLMGCEVGSEFCLGFEVLVCELFCFWRIGFEISFLSVISDVGFLEGEVLFFKEGLLFDGCFDFMIWLVLDCVFGFWELFEVSVVVNDFWVVERLVELLIVEEDFELSIWLFLVFILMFGFLVVLVFL